MLDSGFNDVDMLELLLFDKKSVARVSNGFVCLLVCLLSVAPVACLLRKNM